MILVEERTVYYSMNIQSRPLRIIPKCPMVIYLQSLWHIYRSLSSIFQLDVSQGFTVYIGLFGIIHLTFHSPCGEGLHFYLNPVIL